jgi:hypothetical protein
MGCTENRPEEAELAVLTDVLEANARQRWPEGTTTPSIPVSSEGR